MSYIIWVAISVLIVAFFLTHLISAILPPKIIVTDPKSDEFRTDIEDVMIRGMVKRSYFLRIGDTLIPFNDDGSFEERVSLTRDLNIIKIEAESRFGKKSEKIIKIFNQFNQ